MAAKPMTAKEKERAAGVLLAERLAEQRMGKAGPKGATKKSMTGRAARGLKR